MLLRLPEVMYEAAALPLKVLFVCHYNRHRSATAERVFCKVPDLDVRSAGTSTEAMVRVNERMLEWADVIFVMDDELQKAIQGAFPDSPALAHLVCLHIPDDYNFLDPRLVTLLQEGTAPHLDRLRAARAAGAAHSQSPKPN